MKDFAGYDEVYKSGGAKLIRDPEMVPSLEVKVPIDEGDIRPNNND
jgi:hypothetical protein